LVEYMLADLKTRLEDSGRLDLMDAVGRRALDYYRAQSPGGLDAASLGRRARALQLVGEVSALRGHMGEALRSFEAASATTAETLSRAPRDPDRIFDHAQSAFWVGDIAWQRGEMATAEANFQEYRRLADQLVARDPADDRWRAEVNYAYSSLGAVMIDDGRAIEAERDFQRSLAMTQALVAKHPGDTKRLIDLGQSHAWLATALEEQGRFAEARAHRRTELALYGPILDADPSNQGASFSAIVATRALARMALLEGDARTAVAGFSDAAARAERLLASQRDNMDVEAAAAIAEIDLAEALLAVGRLSPAQAAQERGAALAATALANDSTVALWRQCRDHARLAQAAIALRRGDAAGALRLDSATLAALAAPASGGGLNAEPRRLQLRAKLQAGDDLSALGQGAQARAQWSAIVTALRGPTSDYGPRLLLVLEAADTRLGRAGEAAAVARRLAQMGAGPGAAGRGRLSPARSRHTSGTRRP
jgi:tetratricopeptide (TPR) repeat protein